MKINRRPFLGALLALLLFPALPSRGDSITIISEWYPSIQFISTESFLEWPEVDSAVPVAVSAEADRIWLIWPKSLISLNSTGKADVHSLLALFASSRSKFQERSWSPENGLICSDGIWRSVDSDGTLLFEMDCLTGIVRIRPWVGDIPEVFYPGPEGSILNINDSGATLILSGDEGIGIPESLPLEAELPPVSLIALSRQGRKLAWKEVSSAIGHIVSLPASGESQTSEMPVQDFPAPGRPWGMDWAGNILVLAGPGSITGLEQTTDGEIITRTFEDPRLPKRWYRIHGGRDNLLIHSPETGLIAQLRISSPESENSESAPFENNFRNLLETQVLNAGLILEEKGFPDQAVTFYGWALPLVQSFRSREPLKESWPALEHEIADRRADLRDQF